MSQLFDSLRRPKSSRARQDGPRRPAQPNAVLATMGYASGQRGSGLQKVLVLLAIVSVATATGWYVWRWYSGDGAKPVSMTVRRPTVPESSPAGGAPAASAHPGAGPSAVQPKGEASRPVQPTPAKGVRDPNVTTRDRVAARKRERDRLVTAPHPLAPATAAAESPPARDADRFTLALYYQRSGDFENALLNYRALLQQNELNAHAHNNLGLLYQSKGMLDEAIREFRRALAIDADYVKAHNNLGVALLGQGSVDAAAAEFRTVLRLDRRDADAMVNLALTDKALGRTERAKEALLRVLNVDPRNAPAHYNLAVLYEESGESERAIEHYRAFLSYAGDDHADRVPGVRARLEALGNRNAG